MDNVSDPLGTLQRLRILFSTLPPVMDSLSHYIAITDMSLVKLMLDTGIYDMDIALEDLNALADYKLVIDGDEKTVTFRLVFPNQNVEEFLDDSGGPIN